MKKLLLAASSCALMAGAAGAEDVKLGILIGFTGPIESLTPNMAAAAELAMAEANASGAVANGWSFVPVRADSTCGDASAATAAAERLITSDAVNGIVGADCSGVTRAVLTNVAMPNGMVMISPSATSPALSQDEDNGLFFRTAPSDAREGEVAADILVEKGVKSVAITYTNNDFGKGESEFIEKYFKEKGGSVTINASHEDGKADYSAEVAALASAGGEVLVVAGYLDQGGKGIIQAALDTGAFSTFYLPGGMIGDSLPEAIGPALDGSFGDIAASDAEGNTILKDIAAALPTPFDSTTAYASESYDAAALFILAMQAAGSTDPKVYKDKIMEVANAPGEKINPGELGKALKLISEGKDVDYQGATGVEMIEPGEAAGRYREIVIKDGKVETVKYH
ncbi:ABC transporter substrate-binding protein [Xinfangfangia pollutisoli]|uniref:ABC transporter substrate-binding protein n=1 Tax=Xinfangfangia pollutisoli TaxID=2865960 RepID=UPI001CD2A5B0|nr:ABC transporter substrate-binding protein [Xinfangfangia pollutisoli]